jgi:hypothetical protein
MITHAPFDPSKYLGPIIVVVAVLLIYGSRLTQGKMRETAEGLVFPIKPIYAWARGIVLPAYMGFFLWIAWQKNHVMPWPIIFLCLIALAIGALQMPGTIILTAMAVTQRFWFQKEKVILYNEVMAIQTMQAGRTTLVLGDNRVRIRHSANHSAPEEFRRELERRTNKRTAR